MRTREALNAYIEYVRETRRLTMAARTPDEAAALNMRTGGGQLLYEACLADGWTREEAMHAIQAVMEVGDA